MEYAKLEAMYDQFISSSGYKKLHKLASMDETTRNNGLVMMFLNTKFKLSSKYILNHKDLKVLIDDNLITLDITMAPNFDDQDKFLAWLHKQIFDQT